MDSVVYSVLDGSKGCAWVRFPGQVMILGRNGTDDQDEQVEGLIAGAVVANTNVASAHPRPVSSRQ